MAKTDLPQLLWHCISVVAQSFRTFHDVHDFQRRFPYYTAAVSDPVSAVGLPLPQGYSQHRLYLLDGRQIEATIDLAFKDGTGLVNFSYLAIPRGWGKRAQVKECLYRVIPHFIRSYYPHSHALPPAPGMSLFLDPLSHVAIQVRPHLGERGMTAIGFALIDADHV